RHVLASRLKRLVEAGVFRKQAYQPGRYEYRLTEMGLALYPVIMAMAHWGDTWLDEGKGAPLVYRPRSCRQLTTPPPVCPECGEPLDPRQVTPLAGPALHPGTLPRELPDAG